MSSSTFRKLKRISEREREGERKLGGRGSAKKKGRMGNQKQKWTSEEEGALLAGVAKHGAGKWKNILKDPEFSPSLILRSNIDLKVPSYLRQLPLNTLLISFKVTLPILEFRNFIVTFKIAGFVRLCIDVERFLLFFYFLNS